MNNDSLSTIEIVTAISLSDSLKEKIEAAIKKNMTKEQVTFLYSINKKILGGFSVLAHGKKIDLTLKNEIRSLSQYLKKA